MLFYFVCFSEAVGIKSKPMPFLQGIKMVMGYGPYAKLVMGFLFTSLAFMVRTDPREKPRGGTNHFRTFSTLSRRTQK